MCDLKPAAESLEFTLTTMCWCALAGPGSSRHYCALMTLTQFKQVGV